MFHFFHTMFLPLKTPNMFHFQITLWWCLPKHPCQQASKSTTLLGITHWTPKRAKTTSHSSFEKGQCNNTFTIYLTWYQGLFDLEFLANAFWWLLGLISLAVSVNDCFLAALLHHHGCVDVVLNIFGGSLLVHLCLVVGVYCLYSRIRISLSISCTSLFRI